MTQQSEKRELFPQMTLAVIGRPASGKSTLIHAFVTLGTPFLQVREVALTDELLDVEKWVDEDVMVYLYCIHATQETLTIEEQQFIHQLARRKKVILVMTQSVGMHSEERRRLLEEAQLGVDGIVAVMAKSYPIYESVTMPVFGLEELLDQLMEAIPDCYEETVIAMQRVNISLKIDSAKNRIDEWLQEQFGHLLQEALSLTMEEFFLLQRELLEQLLVYFTVSASCQGQEALLDQFLTEEQELLQRGKTMELTGISASIVTYAFATSVMEILAMSYKKDHQAMTLTASEKSHLLAAKFEQRLKLGKQNPAMQRFMRKNHYTQEIQKPTVSISQTPVKVSKKGIPLFQKTQKKVAKFAHDSLDAFSKWARK